MSVPATNARSPAPVMTTARSEASASSSRATSVRRAHIANVIALRASGRSTITHATDALAPLDADHASTATPADASRSISSSATPRSRSTSAVSAPSGGPARSMRAGVPDRRIGEPICRTGPSVAVRGVDEEPARLEVRVGEDAIERVDRPARQARRAEPIGPMARRLGRGHTLDLGNQRGAVRQPQVVRRKPRVVDERSRPNAAHARCQCGCEFAPNVNQPSAHRTA